MFGSAIVYSGYIIAAAGLALVMKPMRRLRVTTRLRGLSIAAVGVLLAGIGLILPAPESRASGAETRLDEFAPVWQFREFHTIRIAVPPTRVFEAIKRVRADDIFLLGTLTWIRRGGQPVPDSVRKAVERESMIEVALSNGFVRLADDSPRELVIGAVVRAPPGTRGTLTPEVFKTPLPPGFALATMNFLVAADGPNASAVSTETRVFANSPSARRQFAAYWRLIYPGSAIIRRSWLRAIRRRAMSPDAP